MSEEVGQLKHIVDVRTHNGRTQYLVERSRWEDANNVPPDAVQRYYSAPQNQDTLPDASPSDAADQVATAPSVGRKGKSKARGGSRGGGKGRGKDGGKK